MNIDKYKDMQFETRAIKSGEGVDPTTHAVNTPIYLTTTYGYETTKDFEKVLVDAMDWVDGAYLYSRTTNPTTEALEFKIASLEKAESSTVTPCGMAAISVALLSNLNQGDHCIVSNDIFIVTRSLFEDVLPSKGIETDIINIIDLDSIKNAIKPNTKVIYLESCSNPRLELADIESISKIAKEHSLILIVDNTFLSPYLLKPIELGADIVIHSGTKFVVGHGDGLLGLISGTKKMMDRAKYYSDNLGTHISPFNSWLSLRSVKTLNLRLDRQCSNAMKIAEFLESRPEVDKVYYPGLKSHDQHDLAKKILTNGYGSMVTFHLKGGYEEMAKFVDNVSIPPIGTSLGDVVTLIHPKHAEGDLIRLSVGCENVDDLINDLLKAFQQI
ncbi:MAG: aminotransferase class I/II-fold pyridoxal phosphate-dependent enzyme [Tissierellia bacterium]|nr:aminotransferase class I/II-fold pyridoxal phosphate-dependent enzyme [Tissierellia bacterium]